MPLLRQSVRSSVERFDLSPFRNPPPWMNMTKGVGLGDFAFHKSSTLRECGPYATLARSGDDFSGLACSKAAADNPSVATTQAARMLAVFMIGSGECFLRNV